MTGFLCPLCVWQHGKRTKQCVLHVRIAELEARVAELEAVPIKPLSQVETELINKALVVHGSAIKAAEALGMGKTTIYRKLKAIRSLPPAA